MPKKSNKTHSATDLNIKTELFNSKGVRLFVNPLLACSWRIFREFSDLTDLCKVFIGINGFCFWP